MHWWHPSGTDVQACSAYCGILFGPGPYDTQSYDPLVPFTLLCLLGQVRSSLCSIILACYCFWIAVVTGLHPSPSSSSDSRLLGENARHKPWWKCSQLLIKYSRLNFKPRTKLLIQMMVETSCMCMICHPCWKVAAG